MAKYPLISQKFKLHNKYLPEPQFEAFAKNNNSILFKSSLTMDLSNTQQSPYFQGLIFQQVIQNSQQKAKPYSALCYQGRFSQHQAKNGSGFAIFDNGDIYEGQWKDNMIDGNGIYTVNQSKAIYEGEFKKWKKDGKGKLVSTVDRKFTYEGDFVDNFIHGKGKIQYEDGSQYEGDFKFGQQEGHGTYETANMKYEGGWRAGLMCGSGTAVWYSEKRQIVSKYTGQYYQGKKHGFGEYEGKNGKLLRGQWFEGKFNMGSNSFIIE